ncbi:hypothetical protein GC207_13150 [bacterium]|nr:hypothetical protein [bacterium]
MTKNGKKANRGKRWLVAAVVVVILMVVGWFILTSGAVIKAMVLPRVASAIHADLTVDDVSLSPFSGIELTNLKLAPAGGKPIVEAQRADVKYHLFQLIGGTIAVDQVELVQPRITVRQRADGGSDLQDWLAGLSKGTNAAASQPTGSGGGKPPQLAIGSVTIKDGTLLLESTAKDGSVSHLGVGSLDFTLDQLKNGVASQIKLGAVVNLEKLDRQGAKAESLSANLDLDAKANLGADLMPSQANVKLSTKIANATGSFSQVAGLMTELTVQGSMAKIDELKLAFLRDGKTTGELTVSGSFDQTAGAGAFDVAITNLPPGLLAVAASSVGSTFDLAGFVSTNHVTIAGSGKQIGATGKFKLNGLVAHKEGKSTPRLDLDLNYATVATPDSGSLVLSSLGLNAQQNGNALLDVQTKQPFHYNWKGAPTTNQNSDLSLTLTNLNVAEWQPLTGPVPLDGTVGVAASIHGNSSGNELAVQLNGSLDRAALSVSSNKVDQLAASFNFAGNVQSMNDLEVKQLATKLTHAGKPVIDLSASGKGTISSPAVDLQTKLNVDLPQAAGLAGTLPMTLRQGTLTYDGSVNYSTNRSGATGMFRVDGFDGDLAGATLKDVAIATPVKVTLTDGVLDWSVDPLKISRNAKPAMELQTDGQLQLATMTGHFKLALPLINEQLVNPFLAAYTPQQTLRSAQAAVTANGDFQPDGKQVWSLESHSTNIVLVATNGNLVAPPLATRAAIEVDVNTAKKAVTIKRWEGTLFSDAKPSGHFTTSGDIRLGEGQASLNLQVAGINENALRPLAPLLLGDKKLDKANLEAAVNVDYQRVKPSRVRASIGLTNVKITDPAGRFPQTPQMAKANFDASIVSNRLDIADSRLQITPTSLATNLVELTGWLDYGRTDAIKGDLALRSPGFDGTPIYAMFAGTGSTNAPATEPPPSEPKPAKPAAGLPVDRVDLAVDIKHFHLGELVATNFLANATVRSNAFELGKFTLLLNDAPINARLASTNNAGDTHYQLAAEIESLPLEPFVHTFKPDFKGQMQGQLYTAVHLHGTAPPGTNLIAASVGDIFFGITNANFEPFSRRWQTALRPVGLLLQTPELFSSPITWAYLHTSLTNRSLNLTNLTVISDAYVLDANTEIPLQNDLTNSPIPRTPLNLYLSRNLVTQLGILKGSNTNQAARFVALPVFAHVGGTLGNPQVETDKLKLTGMTIGKAADFVGGSAGDVLRKAGSATEGLGEILSGKKLLGSEEGKENVVSKGIGGIFNAVGNVLGGSGKAVEKGTGAVTGTKAVDQDVIASRMKAFDWPRVFTNAAGLPPAKP